MRKKECVAMLLAGGQGSRLGVLTEKIAKPAVSFGGKYRMIDFSLSNCVNSGIDTVGVLIQYKPSLLNRYLGTGAAWDLDAGWGGAVIKSLSQVETPPQSNVRPRIEAVKHNGKIIGFVDIELGTMRSLNDWLHDIHALKKDYPDRALVASMLYGGAPVEARRR